MTRDGVLTSLRNLTDEKPTTKMGQVRWAWPEIQAALAAGHTLQLIHQRLVEGGIDIDYRTLSLYIGRLERRRDRLDHTLQAATPQAGKTNPSDGLAVSEPASGKTGPDPFANIRAEREKKKTEGFKYHPFSANKTLLE